MYSNSSGLLSIIYDSCEWFRLKLRDRVSTINNKHSKKVKHSNSINYNTTSTHGK